MDKVFITLGNSNDPNYQRQVEDFYASDDRAARHIFAKVPELYNCNAIVEPAAGDGTMADVISEITGKSVAMFDIVRRREDIVEANYENLNIKNQYDLIITNPPYRQGTKQYPFGLIEFINKTLDDVRPDGYVALLLKTLHLEGQARFNQIYRDKPPKFVYVYVPRIDCYKDNVALKSNKAISYSWFVWYKDGNGSFGNEMPRLGWIEKL